VKAFVNIDDLITADGAALRLHHWPCSGARGSVLLVHGLGEHGGRYDRLATTLNNWGWNVVAHDHRGHGRSSGKRGCIDHGAALLEDLALVIDAVRAQIGGSLVLLGHSMG